MIENRLFDKDESLQNELANLISAHKLVPILGSGFTRDAIAHSGKVPTGKDMEQYLRSVLAIAYNKAEDNFSQQNFAELCTLYDRRIAREEKFTYFTNNFTEVDLSSTKVDFLSLNWPYIYTLNIDDAIERNCPKYSVILPRKEYNEQYVETFDIVFKIHGDIHYYLKYIESEELIFNKKQYIESLRNNRKMLTKFKDDFAESNLLFIGCSLKDEPDLLSVISDALSNNKTQRNTYYLSNEPVDDVASDLLEDYGITTCIVAPDYDAFYNTIVTLAKQQDMAPFTIIDYYKESDVVAVTFSDKESKYKHLLNSNNLVHIPFDQKFYKPPFFISRDVTTQVLDDLKYKSPIHIIYGHRISGKTFCLFDIYESIKNKERYYFPSGTAITREMLDSLFQKNGCFIAFDTNCLSVDQIDYIVSNRSTLDERDIFIVIAINSSDRFGVDILADNNVYGTTYVHNVFSKIETVALNNVLENVNLPTFRFVEHRMHYGRNHSKKIYHTLLDNLYEIAQKFSHNNPSYFLPDLSKITKKEELSVMILMATQQMISSYDMYYFDIVAECNSFIVNYPTLMEYVYYDSGQSRRDSRQKMIVNAKFYLLKELGEYAHDESKHSLIAEAYRYIYENIKRTESTFEVTRRMLDFVKFDVLNDVFYRKNNAVIRLINYLYEQLEPEMNTNPQFKHQRAKSILWLCKDSLAEMVTAADYTALAIHDTKNILARKYNERLRYSLEHIKYTHSIILGRICAIEQYSNLGSMVVALNAYDEALFSPQNEEELKALRARTTDKRMYSDLKDLINAFQYPGVDADEELQLRASDLASRLACF